MADNTNILDFNQQFLGAKVKKTGTQALTSGVSAIVTFDSEIFDDGGWHDNVTNNSRLTVPEGVSKIILTASIELTASAGGNHRAFFFLQNNVTTIESASSPNAFGTSLNNVYTIQSMPIEVVEDDYLEIAANVDTAGISVLSNSYFSAYAVQF